ncbi:MAG: DHHA2 domain-containing protein [Thermodesulfobacteriota bacterium]
MSTPSFQTYLASCRELLAAADPKTVVIGNEAADLDSMASSLAYGYLLAALNADDKRQIIPVMPIPRADFKLRTEAVYVFNKAGINLTEVIFFDEVDLPALMANDGQLVLMDHNKLAMDLDFGEQVTAIIDHHVDEGLYLAAQPRIIELVGSTCSLVAKEINRHKPTILAKKLATLLLGTILLDTVNLDPEAGRLTPADQEAADLLLPIFASEQDKFFGRVQEEKFNCSDLSTPDLLRKDYKQWQLGAINCGIGSVLMPVVDWLAKDNELAQAFSDFAAERGLDVLLAMNAYTNPGFSRDLVIFATSQEAHDKLLAELKDKGLELTSLDVKLAGAISCHNQGNLGISRKKLQPILAAFYG